jgi:predicted cupin superfamily sugar epimerase
MNSKYWINKLNLAPHPEGGYYKETYRSNEQFLPGGFSGLRNVSTTIYFLLEEDNKSHFHRIKSDEHWFFHEGSTIEILLLNNQHLSSILLGKDPDQGEVLQAVVPAGYWFAARMKDGKGYGLVSCTVAPGFDFNDFELASRKELIKQFPKQEKVISEMSLH